MQPSMRVLLQNPQMTLQKMQLLLLAMPPLLLAKLRPTRLRLLKAQQLRPKRRLLSNQSMITPGGPSGPSGSLLASLQDPDAPKSRASQHPRRTSLPSRPSMDTQQLR